MAAKRTYTVKMVGDADQLNRTYDEVGRNAGGMQATVASSFGKMTRAAGIAAVGLGVTVGVAKTFADAAGDMGESQNRASVIFEASTDQVTAFADEATKSFGMSKRAATDAAASFGLLLKPTGLASDRVAEMSVTLAGLSADVGSLHNMAQEDAAGAMFSGLAGETEGMKRLGVDLSAAKVEAQALIMGLGDLDGALTEQEKVQARYALILAGTTDAVDDYRNTSDSLANSTKAMNAEWENAKAVLGEQLAPAFAAVFGYVAEQAPVVVEWLSVEIPAAIEWLKVKWEEWGPAITQTWTVVWENAKVIWETIRGVVSGAFTFIEGVWKIFNGAFTGDWGMFWDGIVGVVQGAWEIIRSIAQGITDALDLALRASDQLKEIVTLGAAGPGTAERMLSDRGFEKGADGEWSHESTTMRRSRGSIGQDLGGGSVTVVVPHADPMATADSIVEAITAGATTSPGGPTS